jgi:phenylalanyl-tRNA synthetase alpha subunit
MLKYGIKDIREFYKSNLDFLEQFKWSSHIVI